jgi:hypothetical protein
MRTFLADLSSVMLRVWHFGLHAQLTNELLSSFVDLEWNLPQLRILNLFSHSGCDMLFAVPFSSNLFHNTPNLVRVTIQNAITSAPKIQHVLPWSQLTHITVAYQISLSRWIEILNMCPLLRRCDILLGKSDEATSSTSLDACRPKGIHNLKLLALDVNDWVSFLKPLSVYNLPSQTTLHILYHSEPFLPVKTLLIWSTSFVKWLI